MTTSASLGPEEDDEDDFEVSAITSSDGTRVKPAAPPPTAADLLGVSGYAASDSDSDVSHSDSEEQQQRQNSKPAETNDAPLTATNGTLPAKRSGEMPVEPPSKRKRVQFVVAEEELAPMEEQVMDPIVSGASAEEEAELEAALAAFEAEVGGAGEDLEERDVDLAEAEDAREEAVQQELRKRVQNMRERLKGEKGMTPQAAKLNVGGEEIRLKVRERKVEKKEEEDDSDSEGDIDLMRDWTQFAG